MRRAFEECFATSAGLCLAGLGLLLGAAASRAAAPRAGAREPAGPCVYLFDTLSASADPLGGKALLERPGWTAPAEDDLTHRFKGDAVFLNDKLVVVLRAKGGGAEVYARAEGGCKLRAVLSPLSAAGDAGEGLSSLRIIENNPGAVMLDAAYRTAGGRHTTPPQASGVAVKYRLTAGQISLEARAGEGAGRLRVGGSSRCVIVPDFFCDDMVFDAEAFEGERLGLPAENLFLSLADDGNAMLMCVWQSGRQEAAALFSQRRGRRVISGCEIQCARDKAIWVAVMEGRGIWQERAVSPEEARGGLVADWKLPFAAKWRADLVRDRGLAESWTFRAAGEGPSEAGAGDACYRPESGRAVVRLPPCLPAARTQPAAQGRASRPPALPTRFIIVYPIDRSQETPLTTFCPTDVMRNSLGVGPCQYILETEGLSSQTDATSDQVTTWVEKQFAGKKEKDSAEEMKERLKQMTDHVARAQARIQQYVDLVREARAVCAGRGQDKGVSPAVRNVQAILGGVERSIAEELPATQPPETPAQLASRIVALIGGDDPLPECRIIAARLRAIGSAQDRMLSRCRMSVRWLARQCGAGGAADAGEADLLKKIQTLSERMLQSQAPRRETP